MKMKSSQIFGWVAVTHVVIVCVLILLSGCQTLRKRSTSASPVAPVPVVSEPVKETVMPPPPPMPPLPPPAEPKPVAPPKAVVERPDVTTQYVVGKGDTLSGIAAKFGVKKDELAAINGISDPRKLRAGQKIHLPGKIDVAGGESKSGTGSASTVTPAVAEGGNVYIVKVGDSLGKVAKDHGVSTADLKSLNKLNGDMIRIGQKLVIPQARAAGASAAKPDATDAAAGNAPAKPVESAANKAVDKATEKAPVPAAAKAGEKSVEPAAAGAAGTKPGTGVAEPAAGEAAAGAASAQTQTHVVGDNEDLYSVALTWGVSVAELKELNGLSSTTLKKGQRLKIPMPQ